MPDPALELRPPADIVKSIDSHVWAAALLKTFGARPDAMQKANLEFWCRAMLASGHVSGINDR